MSGLIGKKIGMTSIFDEKGKNIPCTVIEAGPCVVTQIKTSEVDGYNAVQLGFNDKNEKHSNKSEAGHFSKSKSTAKYKLVEFQNFEQELNLGDSISVDHFNEGEFVDVTGKSIGKGFAGNQKRHNFTRGPMSHGSKNHRAPGSIGQGTTPGRIYRGKKMAGHMGAANVTMKKLKILKVDTKQNLLILKGSVPGKPGNLLSIRPTNCKG